MYNRKHLSWVRNSLWYQDTYVLAVVEDYNQKGMYRIVWADDVKSDDYYNLTRAKENAVNYTLTSMNRVWFNGPRKAVGALFWEEGREVPLDI